MHYEIDTSFKLRRQDIMHLNRKELLTYYTMLSYAGQDPHEQILNMKINQNAQKFALASDQQLMTMVLELHDTIRKEQEND